MLVRLLTVTAVFIGGCILAAIIEAWKHETEERTQPTVLSNRQVSLWSLILCLFFPSLLTPIVAKRLPFQGTSGIRTRNWENPQSSVPILAKSRE